MELAWDELVEKGNFFYLANWQTSQMALLSTQIEGYKECMFYNLWLDRCPNLKSQSVESGIWVKELGTKDWESLLMEILQWGTLETEELKAKAEGEMLNLYKPP